MVVVPLATFVIMPGMVLALLLMPLGLEWIGYVPMAYGTDIMIRMARWVTSLPYASLHLPSPTGLGLSVSTFGLLWLCLMQGRYRIGGIAFIAFGMATIAQHVPVDVLVSGDAHQVMVRLDSGHYTTLKGTARSFTVQNWLRSEGEDELVPLKDTAITCDRSLCTYNHNGYTLKMIKKPQDNDAVAQACSTPADVVIAWRYIGAAQCPQAVHVIGRAELESGGAHALWLEKNGIRTARTRQGAAYRLWQLPLKPEELDDEAE